MRDYNQRLGEARSTLCEWVYRPSARDPWLARPCKRLKSFNVDPISGGGVTAIMLHDPATLRQRKKSICC